MQHIEYAAHVPDHNLASRSGVLAVGQCYVPRLARTGNRGRAARPLRHQHASEHVLEGSEVAEERSVCHVRAAGCAVETGSDILRTPSIAKGLSKLVLTYSPRANSIWILGGGRSFGS